MKKPEMKKIIKSAQENIIKDGQLMPTLFVEFCSNITKKTSLVIIGLGDFAPDKKISMMSNAGRIALAHAEKVDAKVIGMSMLFESWLGQNLSVAPSQDPERKEAIVFDYTEPDGRSVLFTNIFTHKKNGKPVFQTIKEMSDNKDFSTKSPLVDAFWREVYPNDLRGYIKKQK